MNRQRHNLNTSGHIRYAAFALALITAGSAHAISIGDAVLLSSLGEPLHAEVPLLTDAGETVADNCLSLAVPGTKQADSDLTQAELALRTVNGRYYVDIRTRTSFNQPFASFRLQIQCPGKGSVARTLTILPDIDTAPMQPLRVDAAPSTAARRIIPQTAAPATSPQPRRTSNIRRHQPPVRKPDAAQAGTAAEAPFVFKLSGSMLDTSRIAKTTSKQREALRAQRKQLEADELAIQLLARQYRERQLQHQAAAMQLKLGQLDSPHAVSEDKTAAPAPAAIAPAPQEQITEELDNLDLQRGLAILGLLLALVIPWLGFRYYHRSKSRQPAAKPHPAVTEHDDKETDDHMALEEAELYAIHGHPDKAIAILQDIVQQHPAEEDAWLLLFSIYSAHGKNREFENTAHTFHRLHPDSASWKMVQALGRTLELDNPLYAGDSKLGAAAPFLPHIALSKRRPLGKILVEMGLLTEQDMEIYLAGFDRKQHGRFGNYLVSRRQISHSQLNQALLKQQDDDGGGKLPTLHDMESFLADFDPKRDGSIGEFLLSRKAITEAQLNKVQHQQSGSADSVPAADTASVPEAPAESTAPPDPSQPLEFYPAPTEPGNKQAAGGSPD